MWHKFQIYSLIISSNLNNNTVTRGEKKERDGARIFKSILRMRALWLNEEERNNKRTKWNDPETVKWSLLYSFSSSSSSTVFRPNKNKEVRKYRLCSCNLKTAEKVFSSFIYSTYSMVPWIILLCKVSNRCACLLI